jgi:hypothetical protein
MKTKNILTILMLLSTIITNAQNWIPLLNGTNGAINKILCDSTTNKLYASGSFTDASGISAYKIATWNGTSWASLSNADTLLNNATNANNGFTSMSIYNGSLYVSGWDSYDSTSQIGAYHIAMYDGSNWLSVGSGLNGPAYSMIVYNGELYVGGDFTIAGGVSVNNIAKWNGTNWTAVGNGINNSNSFAVNSLCVFNNDLYAGTLNFSIDNYLFKFNGTTWDPIVGAAGDRVNSMAVYNGELYIGGSSMGIAILKWNGTSLLSVGSGIQGGVNTLHVFNGELYIGGNFSTAGGYSANNVTKWNGTSFSALDSGTNGTVESIASISNILFAGGQFTTAGGNVVNNISIWGNLVSIDNNLTNSVSQILVYPNPLSENATIIFNNNNYEQQNLCIYNSIGQLVFTVNNINTDQLIIERTNFKVGLYYVQLKTTNQIVMSGKFLVE